MAKPVFIIKYPSDVSMKELDEARLKGLASSMSDYHLLFVPTQSVDFEFECYNSEKANEIDFQLLQERVIELTKRGLLN